jgi:hypothetical protein
MDNKTKTLQFDSSKTDWQLEELLQFVVQIQSLPNDLAKLIKNIQADDLLKTYRPGGWNVNQIIHHLADSHMNAWVRTKLLLSEDNPTVKPYDQDLWAAEKDYGYNYEASYVMLVGLHQRWSLLLLECLKTPELLFRTYFHPETNKKVSFAQLIALYGWHGHHHLEQIERALAS